MIRQGEIYMIDFVAAFRRPGVVVSHDRFNNGHSVLVVPITSAGVERRSRYSNCVPLPAGRHGLRLDSVATAENTTLVETGVLIGPPIGRLPAEVVREVVKAIGVVLDADCEPL